MYHPKVSYIRIPSRAALGLPYHLSKIDSTEALLSLISNVSLFPQFYMKSGCHILMGYWQFLDMEMTDIVKRYTDSLEAIERNPDECKTAPILYDLLGLCMQSQGQFKAALTLFEKSLESREMTLEPDDPAIGESFYHLGGLYTQWQKLSSAENYYKQALEIRENMYGANHSIVACSLESLSKLYVTMDKLTAAEPLQKRADAIRQKAVSDHQKEVIQSFLEQIVQLLKEMINNFEMTEACGNYMSDLAKIFISLVMYRYILLLCCNNCKATYKKFLFPVS